MNRLCSTNDIYILQKQDLMKTIFCIYSSFPRISGFQLVIHGPPVVRGSSQMIHNQNSLLHYLLYACILGLSEVLERVKLSNGP